jgi:hypothetical protein
MPQDEQLKMRFVMKAFSRVLAAALVASPLMVSAAYASSVDVQFTNPDKYIDANPRSYARTGKARDRALDGLRAHLEKAAPKYLKVGQTLKVEVLDLDLAGRIEPWRAHLYDVRIMRDIDSPYMKVRYALEENGQVVASGEERISDMDYLWGVRSIKYDGDTLKYEKIMLNDWLRKRFGSVKAG